MIVSIYKWDKWCEIKYTSFIEFDKQTEKNKIKCMIEVSESFNKCSCKLNYIDLLRYCQNFEKNPTTSIDNGTLGYILFFEETLTSFIYNNSFIRKGIENKMMRIIKSNNIQDLFSSFGFYLYYVKCINIIIHKKLKEKRMNNNFIRDKITQYIFKKNTIHIKK